MYYLPLMGLYSAVSIFVRCVGCDVTASSATHNAMSLPRRLLENKHFNTKWNSSGFSDRHVSLRVSMSFLKKFISPKKTPTRKASVSLANKNLSPERIKRELGLEIPPIELRLGDQEAVFEDGVWVPQTGKVSGTFKENERLRKEVKKLEEEKNLLKLKFELLLDMLTETTAEVQLHRGEIEDLRSKLSYSKRLAT